MYRNNRYPNQQVSPNDQDPPQRPQDKLGAQFDISFNKANFDLTVRH